MKRWMQKRSRADIELMAEALGICQATAHALANRGIGTRLQANEFLNGNANTLNDPSLMKDMDKGVAILKEAISKNEKIVVYGDYDVDGVMSTTILYKAICFLNGDAVYYLPHRQHEGYGLNKEAVEKLANDGTDLIITCDNGIAASEEIKLAKQLGMKVVVIDHHEPPSIDNIDIIPPADAVIDPKQKECLYPFAHLCAGGLAYQFVRCLLKEADSDEVLSEFLTLAAIATVCDIVDLTHENRSLVRQGLANIHNTKNLGLRVLIEETQLADKPITEYHMGFIIGPCINAAGRLLSGEMAVRLFCETDEAQARQYAVELVKLNQERRSMTLNAVEEMTKDLEKMDNGSVIVAYSETIHESVAGIVAGRLKEKFYKPVIVLTKGGGMAKGSGRSIEGYNMFLEMQKCKDLFSRFGGHAMAAGVTLPIENIDTFRIRLNESCTLTPQELIPVIKIEAILPFTQINMKLAKELQLLAPFGKGNHTPLFGTKNIRLASVNIIGKNKDILKLMLWDCESGVKIPAISFDGYNDFIQMINQLYGVENCDKIISEGLKDIEFDFVYQVDINSFMGRESIQLIIQDFRLSK